MSGSGIPHKSFRLDEADRALLRALAAHHGISQSDVLRMAIREQARGAGLMARDRSKQGGGASRGEGR